jgi:hypothetical protein
MATIRFYSAGVSRLFSVVPAKIKTACGTQALQKHVPAIAL